MADHLRPPSVPGAMETLLNQYLLSLPRLNSYFCPANLDEFMHNIFDSVERPMSPWILLLLLCGYIFLGLMFFNFIGILATLPFFDYSFQETFNAISGSGDPEKTKIPILIIQGITSLGSFILIPWFFFKVYLKNSVARFFTISSTKPQAILLTLTVMMSFIVVNTIFIEWNMNIEFPSSLKWFEDWARTQEDYLAELTKNLTKFNGIGHFFLGVLVIGVFAGIGEELVFRGLFQNLFNRALGNPHMAIWLSAIIFGAIHMQFYGILPRVLLGALFGYLYYWSGHLGYAMIAHFANNFFMLVMVYLYNQGAIDFDIETTDATPEWWIVLIFAIVTTLLLINFHRLFQADRT